MGRWRNAVHSLVIRSPKPPSTLSFGQLVRLTRGTFRQHLPFSAYRMSLIEMDSTSTVRPGIDHSDCDQPPHIEEDGSGMDAIAARTNEARASGLVDNSARSLLLRVRRRGGTPC